MTRHYYISVVADYGGENRRPDLAFAEVEQRLMYWFKDVPATVGTPIPCRSFDTLETGFMVAQLALNAVPEEEDYFWDKRIIFHNTAPRFDDPKVRIGNQGEGLAYTQLKNGVHVIGVNAGHTFSYLKPHVDHIYKVDIGKTTSQFRSRDNFPRLTREIILDQRKDLLLKDIRDQVPDAPQAVIKPQSKNQKVAAIYKSQEVYVDGYGNIKLSLPESELRKVFRHGEIVEIRVGKISLGAVVSFEGMFSVAQQREKTPLVLSGGSSGWDAIKFAQISKRGENASYFFEKELKRGSYISIEAATNPEVLEQIERRLQQAG